VPPVSSEIVRTDEVALAVHSWGTGDGAPVLLAHPTGFHGLSWAPVAERLVGRGYRVWALDFRGHGDSDRSPNGYSWQGFARDVGAVTRHLRLDGDPRLVAVGHSKGASALLLYEADHPGTYARLWCYEPIMFAGSVPSDFENPLSASALRRRATWPTKEEAERNYASKPPLSGLDPDALHAYVEHGLRPAIGGGFELKCLPDDEAATYAMGVRNGLLDRLDEVHARVVVACGEHTDAITPTFAARMVDTLPNASLEVFKGLGHFGPMEDPGRVAESIATFEAATRPAS
jgi:pimeloyl-ACP methyl ester carboxylesterase